MRDTDLAQNYRDYIACLNAQDWAKLATFVHDDVIHNRAGLRSRHLGLA